MQGLFKFCCVQCLFLFCGVMIVQVLWSVRFVQILWCARFVKVLWCTRFVLRLVAEIGCSGGERFRFCGLFRLYGVQGLFRIIGL